MANVEDYEHNRIKVGAIMINLLRIGIQPMR